MTHHTITAEGSGRFAARHTTAAANSFFRVAHGRLLSSLGIGTYLGEMNDETDAASCTAVRGAVLGGINVIDTALNYRQQRSERSVGAALRQLFDAGEARREELMICTKAGFLTPGAVPEDLGDPAEVVADAHCLAPSFLTDQVERSLDNLGLKTIDVLYLHNPETQLRHVEPKRFEERIRRAFAHLETLCEAGKIVWYGTATWSGYRHKSGQPERLDLTHILKLACEAGGCGHHCRFIQAPVNLMMPEIFTYPHADVEGEQVSLLEVAARAGVTVIGSASIMQSRLASGLPCELRAKLAGPETDAQFAIQFARSTPGLTTALVGMKSLSHVRENLGLCDFPPAPLEAYLSLFRREI